MNRSSLWPALGLFVLLAIAAATIWGFTVGYFVTTWEARTRSGPNEFLAIRYNGEPMIDSYTTVGGVYQQLPQRTLDGEQLSEPRYHALQGANIQNTPPRRTWSDGPVTWDERIARLDRGNSRWLVIHDGRHAGRAYLVEYFLDSKSVGGYIGRRGFSMSPPPEEEQFAVGGPFNYRAQNIAGVGLFVGNAMRYSPSTLHAMTIAPWCIYLRDGDKLVEVDLSTQKVRTLIETGVQSIEIVMQPTPQADDQVQDGSLTGWTGMGMLRKEPATHRLLASLKDSIAVLDPTADERVDFKLPEELRAGDMNAYAISPEQLLISKLVKPTSIRTPSGPLQYQLTWLNNAGERVKELKAEVGSYGGLSSLASAFMGILLLPTLLFAALIAFWFAPFALMQSREAVTYGDGVRQMIEMTWPAGVALLLVCLAAAWLVVRWQKKYDHPHTAVWVVAVFLLGVPGLLAYMIQHGFPRRVPCPACGQSTPQRRDACAACRAPFPAPALKGTEVFA